MTNLNIEDVQLTGDAYFDGEYFNARGKRAGERVLVTWELRQNSEAIAETGDNSEVCDWDNPVSIEYI